MNDTSFERLRAAWRNAGLEWRDTGDGRAQAQAPGHSGWNGSSGPEVSIRYESVGRKTLVTAFNGLHYTDLVSAVGLRPEDLFDDRCAPSWAYPDLTVTKWWKPKKNGGFQKGFRPSVTGVSLDGAPLLYSEDLDLTQPILLVAGEEDATNARNVWGVQAVTARSGEGNATKADMSVLYNAADLRIVGDDDIAGEARVNALVPMLADKVLGLSVWFPHAGCNDLTDHIAAGFGLDDLEPGIANDANDAPNDTECIVSKSASTSGDDGFDANDANDAPSDLLDCIITADQLDTIEYDPIEYAVDGLITEGLGVFAGAPKVGKSWLVGNLAFACAAGGKALGAITVEKRPVLYLALEDSPRRLQDRFRVLSEGDPLPKDLHLFAGGITWENALDLITRWMGQRSGRKPLVIIDTLGKIKPQARSRDEKFLADYHVAGALKSLADKSPGSSVLVVHHTRKGEGADFLEDVSGTNGIAGAADTIMVLRRPRTSNDGTLFVTGRDIDENAYAVTTEGGRWRLDGDSLAAAADTAGDRATESALSSDMVSVLSAVQQVWRDSGEPASVEQIATIAFSRWGVDRIAAAKDRARSYLARLKKKEQVASARRGFYEPTDAYKADHPRDTRPDATSASTASFASNGTKSQVVPLFRNDAPSDTSASFASNVAEHKTKEPQS